MKRLNITLVLPFTVFCLVVCSCFSGSDDRKPELREITISDHSAGLNFSVHLSNNSLQMIYPSVNALSLNLVTAEISDDPQRPAVTSTTYLDRISYSPDIDDSFGRHLFLARDRLSHILYVDSESEENSVLKWLSKSDSEETWWIDAFPGFTEPFMAIPGDEGTLEMVIDEGDTLSLYRLSREAQPTRLVATVLDSGGFQPRGDVSIVRWGDYWAFTVYDSASQRLYFVHPTNEAINIEPIYTAGEVHFSTIAGNRLLVLVFEPAESTITLLERPVDNLADSRPFVASPITLCEGATSVFLFLHDEQRLFLFNERITEQGDRTGYQLSLLYKKSTESDYEKLALVEGKARVEGFDALKAGDVLYVLYLSGDILNLLCLSLADL